MKINKILICLGLVFSFTAQAEIIRAYGIKEINNDRILKLIDKDSLVVIDVDNTIIEPKSKMFSSESPYRRLIDTLVLKSPYYNKSLISWYSKRKLKFTEAGWVDFISKLEEKKANILGIAELNNAIYTIFKEPELWKYNELQGMNIRFTDKISNQESFLIIKRGGRQSIFYRGVIFTGPFTKAETLREFLKVSNLMPKKVIFINDRLEHVKQVAQALKGLNLSYHGIYYKYLNFDKHAPDSKIANFQQEMLLKNGEWLEDEEAERLVNK